MKLSEMSDQQVKETVVNVIMLLAEMGRSVKSAGPMGMPLEVLYLPFHVQNLSLETFYKFVKKLTDTGLIVQKHDCLIWVAGENSNLS